MTTLSDEQSRQFASAKELGLSSYELQWLSEWCMALATSLGGEQRMPLVELGAALHEEQGVPTQLGAWVAGLGLQDTFGADDLAQLALQFLTLSEHIVWHSLVPHLPALSQVGEQGPLQAHSTGMARRLKG